MPFNVSRQSGSLVPATRGPTRGGTATLLRSGPWISPRGLWVAAFQRRAMPRGALARFELLALQAVFVLTCWVWSFRFGRRIRLWLRHGAAQALGIGEIALGAAE